MTFGTKQNFFRPEFSGSLCPFTLSAQQRRMYSVSPGLRDWHPQLKTESSSFMQLNTFLAHPFDCTPPDPPLKCAVSSQRGSSPFSTGILLCQSSTQQQFSFSPVFSPPFNVPRLILQTSETRGCVMGRAGRLMLQRTLEVLCSNQGSHRQRKCNISAFTPVAVFV